jgi:cytochrome c
MKLMAVLVTLMAIGAAAPAQAQAPAQEVPARMNGAAIAQQICAECHAVEAGQPRSPNGQAPTFQTVAATPGMTAIALTATLRTSHRTMPNIILTDEELKNVIAYVLSLK